MATPIATGTIAALLEPGLNSIWGVNYDDSNQEWRPLFDTFSAEGRGAGRLAYVEDQQYIGSGLAQIKGEGQGIAYDSEAQGWAKRYVHVVYGLGMIVTREAYEDNIYKDVANAHAKRLGRSMRITKEIVHANVYNRATTAGYVGGDGVTLLNDAHPMYNGDTFDNLFTADLSETALEDLAIRVRKATDDRGLRIALKLRNLILPPDLEFEGYRILKSILQNDTANNAINALRAMGTFSDGMSVNSYLTDVDAWFVRTNAPEGMKSFRRRAAAFATDNDFDTENMKFKTTERYAVGWTDPRAVYGSVPA